MPFSPQNACIHAKKFFVWSQDRPEEAIGRGIELGENIGGAMAGPGNQFEHLQPTTMEVSRIRFAGQLFAPCFLVNDEHNLGNEAGVGGEAASVSLAAHQLAFNVLDRQDEMEIDLMIGLATGQQLRMDAP